MSNSLPAPNIQQNSPHTVEYFIAKFEAIPDDKWHVGSYDGPDNSHCALGHCGEYPASPENHEARTLTGLLMHVRGDTSLRARTIPGSGGNGPAVVNDGKSSRYQQPTPKARILAALRDVQAKQSHV